MPLKCSICTSKNREKIDTAILQGLPVRHIVAQFGTSSGTVQRHKKHISQQLLKAKKAADIEAGDSLLEQMQKINLNANRLLDTAMETTEEQSSNPNIALLAMKEIRGQLALQLDIFKIMYDMESVKSFQEEVINILSEVDPKAKERFIKRLREKRGIR